MPRRLTITPLPVVPRGGRGIGLRRTFGAGVANRDAILAALSATRQNGAQHIQFTLVAPDAKKVAVVGDFNAWDPSHAGYQARHTGGGVWTVTARVPLGHHRYSFVVDDSVWVADPMAPRANDNDFGLPKSAMVVGNEQ